MSSEEFRNKRPKITHPKPMPTQNSINYDDNIVCKPYKREVFDKLKLSILQTTPDALKSEHGAKIEEYKPHIINICYAIHNDVFTWLMQHSADDFIPKLAVLTYYTDDKELFPNGCHDEIRSHFNSYQDVVRTFRAQYPITTAVTLPYRIQNFADLIHHIMKQYNPYIYKLQITFNEEGNSTYMNIKQVDPEDQVIAHSEIDNTLASTDPDCHDAVDKMLAGLSGLHDPDLPEF